MSGQDSRTEWVRRVLGVAIPAPGGGNRTFTLVGLAKSRLGWRSRRIDAVAEIGRLKAELARQFSGDDSQRKELEAALAKLDRLIGAFGSELDDGLDRVLNADASGRAAAIDAARAQMQRFAHVIETDEIMVELDGNEVLPDMSVVAPLQKALDAISAALGPA